MKVFVIHGDDTVRSNARFKKFTDEAINRNWEIVYIDDQNINPSEIISSRSLFSVNRFFIHRDFKKILKKDFDYLNKKYQELEGNLVLYSNEEIPKTQLKNLPEDTKIEEFKLPTLLWKFLDSFYPGNGKNVIAFLHEIVKTEPVEFVFGLLAKHVRDLYWVRSDPASSAYPSWRIGKLKNQCKKFSDGLLENIINDLAEADLKSKTTSLELVSLLDFIIITRVK